MQRGNRGLGCLGIGTGLLLAILALVWVGPRVFSPGPLSSQRVRGTPLGGVTSHAELEEACGRCHVPLQSQGRLCLNCHRDIQGEWQAEKGLHARFSEPLKCRSCHPDHRGRDADMLAPALESFDHELASFSLQRHAFRYDLTAMACTDCHSQWPVEDRERMEERCYACHARADGAFMVNHVQVFHARCLDCHDGRDAMTTFDHAQTGFPLEGAHAQAACEACHTQGLFETLPTACQDCHQEPPVHQGLFSPSCEMCHTPQGWTPALWEGQPFEHTRQGGFSLARHRRDPETGAPIRCVDCHIHEDGGTLGVFRPVSCLQCHNRRDSRFMREHLVQVGDRCLQCHDGMDRMRGFDHARVFPLDGAHAALACVQCHEEYRFQNTPTSCSRCHDAPDYHQGLFGEKCEYCHTTQAWSPAALRLHRFPLDHGRVQASECAVCHLGNRYVTYTCYTCHEHVPEEIRQRHLSAGIPEEQLSGCVACHPDGQVVP